MVIGAVEVKIVIRDALSLKDKRRVVKSLKDRIRHRFNVSIAEVDHMDRRQQAVLGAAVVTNDRGFASRVLENVVGLVRRTPAVQIVDYSIEMM